MADHIIWCPTKELPPAGVEKTWHHVHGVRADDGAEVCIRIRAVDPTDAEFQARGYHPELAAIRTVHAIPAAAAASEEQPRRPSKAQLLEQRKMITSAIFVAWVYITCICAAIGIVIVVGLVAAGTLATG